MWASHKWSKEQLHVGRSQYILEILRLNWRRKKGISNTKEKNGDEIWYRWLNSLLPLTIVPFQMRWKGQFYFSYHFTRMHASRHNKQNMWMFDKSWKLFTSHFRKIFTKLKHQQTNPASSSSGERRWSAHEWSSTTGDISHRRVLPRTNVRVRQSSVHVLTGTLYAIVHSRSVIAARSGEDRRRSFDKLIRSRSSKTR